MATVIAHEAHELGGPKLLDRLAPSFVRSVRRPEADRRGIVEVHARDRLHRTAVPVAEPSSIDRLEHPRIRGAVVGDRNLMNTAAVERLMLKSKLRRAFERDELRVYYQPKYSLKTGRLEGAEALLRWDLPERGLVLPSDFVPLAEETNLILQLGDWVLNRVCADYRTWQRLVPSPSRISVNLSLRQLQQRRFLDQVRETFRSHGVSPTSLELEITETTLMEDPERTIRILDALYGMQPHPQPVVTPLRDHELPDDFRQAVAEFEQQLLKRALERAQFKQTTAAKLLGLSYHQLRSLLRKHALTKSSDTDGDSDSPDDDAE